MTKDVTAMGFRELGYVARLAWERGRSAEMFRALIPQLRYDPNRDEITVPWGLAPQKVRSEYSESMGAIPQPVRLAFHQVITEEMEGRS